MNSQITIKKIQNLLVKGVQTSIVDDDTSRRMWWASLEVVQKEFLSQSYKDGGIWVASPLPALNEKKLLTNLQGWLWAPEGFPYFKKETAGFLPGTYPKTIKDDADFKSNYKVLNLNPNDGYEPFLMVITPNLQCILTIAGEKDNKILIMRCDESSLKTAIELIHAKFYQENSDEGSKFRKAINNLGELNINDQFSNNFWPSLSVKLSKLIPNLHVQNSIENDNKKVQITEAKLLKAISHEVRTPLATIRTLITSTLRKFNMDESMRNRLIQINNECKEQIDRFGLIFNAAELERKPLDESSLASTDLGKMLEILHPTWSEQLDRKGIKLLLEIVPDLPPVLSDPERLELMLGGLIDRNTRGLQPGGTLLLELGPAGNRLKLQFLCQAGDSKMPDQFLGKDSSAELGPVLSWNPRTGSLHLSQVATKRLLARLGGRLTHRRGSGLTVFFPVADRHDGP